MQGCLDHGGSRLDTGLKAGLWKRAVIPLLFAFAFAGALPFLGFDTNLLRPEALLPLLVCALIAEFLPVELARGGVKLTFTLPFVASVAIFCSYGTALGTDLLATLLAALPALVRGRSWEVLRWTAVNLALSVLGVLGGVFLCRVVAEPLVAVVAFVAGYTAVNFVLVGLVKATQERLRFNDRELLRLALITLGAYTSVALGVGVLTSDDLAWLVPVMLLPIATMRMALVYRTRMIENYYGTIAALTSMLQRAHPYTHGHLERVAIVAEDVARRLGLSRHRARLVREAALLHDIGKIAVDDEVLDKPARLTEEEFAHVKQHSAWGAEILVPVRSLGEIVPWIRHHHERPDGTGYPDRLTDVEIPVESKIIAVVDAFDAMTGSEHPSGKRPYRESMTVTQALEELERCSDSQFDRRVVTAFRAVIEGEVVA